jgi:hypothetical protein
MECGCQTSNFVFWIKSIILHTHAEVNSGMPEIQKDEDMVAMYTFKNLEVF